MDLRTRTSLFCGCLAIAIAVSILLRRRPGRPQIWFAGFALDMGLWYLAQWLYLFVRADVWIRFTAILAVLLPQFALRLFEALMPEPERRPILPRTALILLVPVSVLALLGPLAEWWTRGIVFLYVFGLLSAGLASLWTRSRNSRSRGTQRRVRFLVWIGALAVLASLADFLWFLDIPVPPIGAAFSILFLFVISESLIRQRFVDIYDVLGQVMLSAALASLLAAIFYVFVGLFGGFDTMYLAAFLATIVILVVFDPLREKANLAIHRTFFRERADLERAVERVRRELVHVLQVDALGTVLMGAIEASRRATAAAFLLRDPMSAHFDRLAHFGPELAARFEIAAVQPLLERLEQASSLVLDDIESEEDEARRAGDSLAADSFARVLASAEVLGPFRRGVLVPVRSERRGLIALLLFVDDRAVDAYSPDEIQLLEDLALQASVVLENSRQFQKLQTHDRLAVLGQMAAGLAHEVKNPLGAIKGAAQLLGDGSADALGPTEREFVSIILEEVDRLDRVVGSVLDYARPARSQFSEVDVRTLLERTARMLEAESPEASFEVRVDASVPVLRSDAEQIRQVLLNLARNAVQAMDGAGRVVLGAAAGPAAGSGGSANWVVLSVADEGPGIAPEVMKSLFVPFVTTKERGTGLGLAISQRIVQEMRGRIEVNSTQGQGTTFSILLPSGETTQVSTEIRSPVQS
ncbi:MAG TPA: ATP-binding protein [Polyangiaceae bacterium]|nr:ATP-binding protein [Polyangiaceae bacterium]